MNATAETVLDEPLPIAIRDVREDDWPFIYDSWVGSFVQHNSRKRRSQIDATRATIDALKQRADFKVACLTKELDYIVGFACAEAPVLHYVVVKAPFRGQGVAQQLAAALGLARHSQIFCTHWTSYASKIARQNPYLVRLRHDSAENHGSVT